MSAPDPLTQSKRRAIQYWYVDGTFEFSFGFLCLLLALYFHLESRFSGLWLSAVMGPALMVILVGGSWLLQRFIQSLKENFTYPRTGYVAYRRDRKSKGVWGVAVALVAGGATAALGALLIIFSYPRLELMLVFTSLIMGAILLVMALYTALPRFYLLAGLSIVIGIIVGFAGGHETSVLSKYYLLMGLMLFASGGVTLWKYLRQNPVPQEEQGQ